MPYRPPLKKNSRFDSLKSEPANPFKGARSRRQKNRERSGNHQHPSLRDKIKKMQAAAPKTFSLEAHSFPGLGSPKQPSTDNPINNMPTKDFSHIKDIKEDIVIKEPDNNIDEGWVRYTKINGNWYKEEYVREEECHNFNNIHSVYNVYPSIDERFDTMRYNMNELLGDCSPYWGKTYPWDSDYETDSNNGDD